MPIPGSKLRRDPAATRQQRSERLDRCRRVGQTAARFSAADRPVPRQRPRRHEARIRQPGRERPRRGVRDRVNRSAGQDPAPAQTAQVWCRVEMSPAASAVPPPRGCPGRTTDPRDGDSATATVQKPGPDSARPVITASRAAAASRSTGPTSAIGPLPVAGRSPGVRPADPSTGRIESSAEWERMAGHCPGPRPPPDGPRRPQTRFRTPVRPLPTPGTLRRMAGLSGRSAAATRHPRRSREAGVAGVAATPPEPASGSADRRAYPAFPRSRYPVTPSMPPS